MPVAQWIEQWIPDPKVVGSTPIGHIFNRYLINFYSGPLAQLVEHMIFNHGVTGSTPVWLIKSDSIGRVMELADMQDLGSCGRP